ncbi:hypothetical protein [Glycomyces sp. MUSA5-2]|uniref:hypothetical protein n=1 Tax=Glycomyces sp. MUSA5-2 TaxID=2053002 RepID=UPI003008CA3A
MEEDGPLLREVYPDLVAELERLLEDEGERNLSILAHDLRIVAECGCGEPHCQSIRTAPHPPGEPYGPGHRNVLLDPDEGMLVLDVLNERIVYVEILFRPPMARRDVTRPQ